MVPEGEPVRITSNLMAGKPTWLPDGREILFPAHRGLWRLNPLGGGTPTRLPFVGQDGHDPVVSRTAAGRLRLVYKHHFSDGNVWRVDAAGSGRAADSAPVAAIASTRADYFPNLSPDGRRIAFASDRSEELTQIWVADTDGSNAVQLPSLASSTGAGYPRWSPDGKTIVFHGDPAGRPDVMVVPTSGGRPRILTTEVANAAFPNFSRDGRWIYFCVVENAQSRVWKMPVSGGAAVQVTKDAGTLAIESHDGRDLYYVGAAARPSSLWRMPVAGGRPVKILDGVMFASFDVIERGIYYIGRACVGSGGLFADPPEADRRLQYYDFATGRTSTVARNLGAVIGLSASRDGRTVFFSRIDSSIDELMVVDDFR
jgi:dipeptidyl aminopeptidase/acylaminoacyl peptidase